MQSISETNTDIGVSAKISYDNYIKHASKSRKVKHRKSTRSLREKSSRSEHRLNKKATKVNKKSTRSQQKCRRGFNNSNIVGVLCIVPPTKMAVTCSILVRSRRVLRQNHRIEKTDKMVILRKYENNFIIPRIPFFISDRIGNSH